MEEVLRLRYIRGVETVVSIAYFMHFIIGVKFEG